MFCWYAAGAVILIWNVFQSNGLDVRTLALGGLLPVLFDLPVGHRAIGHTLLAPVAALTVVMLATPGRGRRLVRRRLLGVPIGWMCGVALSGAFAEQHVFWWPAFGADFGNVPVFPSLVVAVLLEMIGVGGVVWCVRRFGLRDPHRRAELVRTGRVSVVEAS